MNPKGASTTEVEIPWPIQTQPCCTQSCGTSEEAIDIMGLTCLQVGQNWWLSIWSNETTRLEKEGLHIHSGKYMTLYFTLGLVSLFVQGGRALLLVLGSFNASRRLHANLLAKVMRLPMAFFDSQPTGRLLNRYASYLKRLCSHLRSFQEA